jgi:hypothetical protein
LARQSVSEQIDVPRLQTAIQRGRKALQQFRENRMEAIREYLGAHWSNDAGRQRVPLNLLSLYVQIVGRSLVANSPRFGLTTFDRGQKPAVSAAEKWINQEVSQIELAETLRRSVIDALFTLGIVKVGLATPADSARLGWNLEAGGPFAETVDFDDFVYDHHARKFAEVGFIGHRVRVPLDAVKDSKLYPGKARRLLQPQPDEPYNQEGDERTHVLGTAPYSAGDEEYEDRVNLWEIYLPRHRLVVTLADDRLTGAAGSGPSADEPLRVQKWLGPYCGPYHLLGFQTVPGNAMPKAPVQDLLDLHLFVNKVYRKLMRQAERQKELLGIDGGATEDGNRLVNADDGDVVRQDNPDRARVQAFGGPNQANLAMAMQSIDRFSWLAGNLDMMGGLSPQSKTLGQDQLLAANASRAVVEMQEQTSNHAGSVGRALLWYWWHDPYRTMKTTFAVPGNRGMSIPLQVGPAVRRQTAFEDLALAVDPYSLQHATPQQRLQLLMETLTQTVLPIYPMLQQSGVVIDWNEFFRKVAELGNMPDLPDVLTMQEPPAQSPGGQGGGGDAGSSMPAATTRTYERRSVGGASQYGKDLGTLNAMNGQGGGGGTGQPQAAAS